MAEQPQSWGSLTLRAFRTAKKGFRRASTGIGGVVLLGGAAGMYVTHSARKRLLALPEEFVLDIDLRGTVLTEQKRPSLARLRGPKEVEVREIVEALEEAAKDPRVKAMRATMPDYGSALGSLAQLQEVRAAVSRFRLLSAERRAASVAYASAFDSTATFYLAAAFQDVFLQPTGMLACTGLASQVPFLRGLLDRWKIVPFAITREEYKNAANPVTEKGFTRAHGEATRKIVQGLSDQLFEGIAAGRGLSLRAVRSAVDAAPLTAKDAASRGLVSGLKYEDEVKAMVTAEDGDGAKPLKTVPWERYLQSRHLSKAAERGRPAKGHHGHSAEDPKRGDAGATEEGEGAADEAPHQLSHLSAWREHWRERGLRAWWEQLLVLGRAGAPARGAGAAAAPAAPHREGLVARGAIVDSRGRGGGAGGQPVVDASKLCDHLEELRKDPAAKAVVLRVDSPGGSAIASDAIHRKLKLLAEAGKRVVVSMSGVAASGGYYISCPAERILAQPGTITGSIGVVFGKLSLAGFLEDQGVHVATVKAGKNADVMSPATGLSAAQERALNRLADDVYADFLSRVAEARGLSKWEARRLAKGRVYTGLEAKRLGLVDEIGGLQDAIRLAKELAGLPEDAEVKTWPGTPTGAELIRKLSQGDMHVLNDALEAVASTTARAFVSSVATQLFGTDLPEALLNQRSLQARTPDVAVR
eukprot:CAMPEP_0177604802 /NCGR_PEP_ID=MMETSP0419_2-20121207/16326_1 /TAXON_ID=582737 /ORGANISM="Tetraselmis sp., Strain GSL018" /LENGTH=699 /DNA_ID=CAMNT_0019098837 /DNA_START=112 /DNA_END=2213 /DNA_ORIENTATION=+